MFQLLHGIPRSVPLPLRGLLRHRFEYIQSVVRRIFLHGLWGGFGCGLRHSHRLTHKGLGHRLGHHFGLRLLCGVLALDVLPMPHREGSLPFLPFVSKPYRRLNVVHSLRRLPFDDPFFELLLALGLPRPRELDDVEAFVLPRDREAVGGASEDRGAQVRDGRRWWEPFPLVIFCEFRAKRRLQLFALFFVLVDIIAFGLLLFAIIFSIFGLLRFLLRLLQGPLLFIGIPRFRPLLVYAALLFAED
mmetsp:Transcript_122899/g.347406  ORF Transcript_122899/g.347406 Transcript_122899/m.347406 type:complete len:246 (+) Transcript_122899:1279-2016(+)